MTQSSARYLDGPVAIIGGGIGGLTAALSLQHFGVPVRVFEQARALREIGAGVTVTPNAMSVLDFLGIGSALAEQAGETLRYYVRSAADGRELERGPDPDSFVTDYGAPYCNLHRGDLHRTLTAAVTKNDQDAIVLDHRFDHLEQDDGGVIAHFSNGSVFAAAALIGADGGASAVRDAVFGGQNASYTGHVALRALVPIARVPRAIRADPYALYVGAGRSLIHYPLRRQTTMNLLGNAQAAQWQAEGWSIPATVGEFLGLFADFPEPVRELIAAIPGDALFKWGLRDREPLPGVDPGAGHHAGRRGPPDDPVPGPGRVHGHRGRPGPRARLRRVAEPGGGVLALRGGAARSRQRRPARRALPGNAASRFDRFRPQQREDRRDARLVLVQPGDRAGLRRVFE